MCVLYGVSASSETTFDAANFMHTGGASLHCSYCSTKFRIGLSLRDWERQIEMVADGRLHPQIELEASFEQIAEDKP
jgi:hypothetical protein